MSSFGDIVGDVVELFASYLSNRCQSVIVDGIVSAPSPLVYTGNTPGFRSGTSLVHVVLPASVGGNFYSWLRLSQVC